MVFTFCLEAYRRGEFPISELPQRLGSARAGGLKPEFALTPEALAARQERTIASIEARVVNGEISETAGKALITKVRKNPAYVPLEVTSAPRDIDISLNDEKMLTPIYELMGGNEGRLFNDLIKYQTPNTEGYNKLLQRLAEQLDANPKLKEVVIKSLREKGLPYEFTVYHGGGDKPLGKYTNVTLDEMNAQWFAEQKAGQKVFSYTVKLDDIVGIGDASVNELFVKSSSLKPSLPKVSIGISSRTISQAEVKELSDLIISSAESGMVKADSVDAFLELMMSGKLPQPHNIRDWAKVFGDDFAKSVGKLSEVPPAAGNQLVDALNMPRSMLASMDLSATLRQGLILGLLHPTQVPRWFGRQTKALLSEKLAYEMDDVLRARPLFNEFVSSGGYIAPMRDAAATKAEEMFMSNLARRIPGIRRSERAFITYLNEARMSAFESGYNTMLAQGASPAQFRVLADFINMASGRGTLPKTMEKYSPALNTILFSPRLQAATLQLPRQIGRMLTSDNPYMRKEAAKALVTFVGGGSAILGLLKATGNKVELDPRSGDFGKIQIGDTRLDIWRGYLQYARFAAQILSGERKSAYGNMNKAERSEIAWRFMQSKSSPAFGLMVDLLRGETYMGEPIFDDTTGFSKAAMQRVLPLAIQDVIDATQQSGMNGLWVAAPATLGLGALTYVNDYTNLKAKIAREMGYDSWDSIDPKTQREIENRNAELQAATIAFDRRVMGTAWGDWRLAGNAIEDVFRQNVDQAVAQYRQTGKGYQFNEKIRTAFTERRGGYSARENEERFTDIVKRLNVTDTAEALVNLGPEQLAIKIYNDALFGDDMYDEFGDYRFDEAKIRKEQLRQSLGGEMVKYIEDYSELKFETLPPEFQMLMEAKIIMRPYWEVTDRVVKLFGKQFAETPSGQSLVSKLRKAKRLADPKMEAAYQRFYAQ